MITTALSLAGLLYSGINQIAGSVSNALQPEALQPVEPSGFGDAVLMKLSPAATAAMAGGQNVSAAGQNPVSNIASGVYSAMGAAYSAGNTGMMDSNNSFFEELFAGGVSSNSKAHHAPAATGNPSDTGDATDSLLASLV